MGQRHERGLELGGGEEHAALEHGVEVPVGEEGTVYFEDPDARNVYYKDPGETAALQDAHGWRTLGDVGRIDADFHDLEGVPEADRRPLLDPDSYAASQAFAAALRSGPTNGIHYPSVRRPRGRCVAAFRPKAVGIPKQTRHLKYYWDGTAVRQYFDYQTEEWVDVARQHLRKLRDKNPQ